MGELCVIGDNVAKQAISEDGFLHTGDLAYFDSDEYLHIVGRKKRVIITSNGKNVYPEELEELLLNNEIITEAVVFEKDNHICAKIVSAKTEDAEKYLAQINERLPEYKRIKELSIIEADTCRASTNSNIINSCSELK